MTKLNVSEKSKKSNKPKRLCQECGKPMQYNYYYHTHCMEDKFQGHALDDDMIYEGGTSLPRLNVGGSK